MPDHPLDDDSHLAEDCRISSDGPTDVTDGTSEQPGIGWTLVDGETHRTQVLYLDDETTLANQRTHRGRGRDWPRRLPRVLRRQRRAQLRQLERLLQMSRGLTPPAGSAQ